MKERIRKIRKEAGLTQEAFAQKIGIKRNTVATYETTDKIPLDAIINSICRVFNVNEEWLKSGIGEMYITNDSSDEFNSVMEEIGVTDQRAREIILNYSHLSVSEKERFWEVIDKLLANGMEGI